MKSRAQKQARWYLYLATSTHVCRGFWICMKTSVNKNIKMILKQFFYDLKRTINGGNCYYLLNVLYKIHRGGTGTVCLGGGRRKNKYNRTAHWDTNSSRCITAGWNFNACSKSKIMNHVAVTVWVRAHWTTVNYKVSKTGLFEGGKKKKKRPLSYSWLPFWGRQSKSVMGVQWVAASLSRQKTSHCVTRIHSVMNQNPTST